jgi:hypothetical protein
MDVNMTVEGMAENERVLAEIKNEFRRNPIVIWGTTELCRHILLLLDDQTIDMHIVDTYKSGEVFEGHEIEKPTLTNSVFAKNTIFILALNLESSYKSCELLLKEAGYENITSGQELYWKLLTSKYKHDIEKYDASNTDQRFSIDKQKLYLHSSDWHKNAGASFNNNFLVQDLWAAKKVFENKPAIHYDIGSKVDGFIAHLLSFGMKTVLIDIRELETYGTENLTFIKENATMLTSIETDSIESLSALCSIEHFGLGRYGDPIEPDAHLKAFQNMQRVMKAGGNLYLSVPVADECRVDFHYHRVYSVPYILDCFASMQLVEFSYNSRKGLVKDVDINMNFDYSYNVGLFHFKKKK